MWWVAISVIPAAGMTRRYLSVLESIHSRVKIVSSALLGLRRAIGPPPVAHGLVVSRFFHGSSPWVRSASASWSAVTVDVRIHSGSGSWESWLVV